MTLNNKNNAKDTIIAVFKKTKEIIFYAVQYAEAVRSNDITPEHFKFRKEIPEEFQQVDWNKEPRLFKSTAQDISLMIVGFAIIMCNEGLFDLTDGKVVEKEKNPDLNSAVMIFRLIRNAMGHPYIESPDISFMRWNISKKKYQRIYEVKEIEVKLDATNLNKKKFEMKHLGGWKNFLKLLEYLETNINQITVHSAND